MNGSKAGQTRLRIQVPGRACGLHETLSAAILSLALFASGEAHSAATALLSRADTPLVVVRSVDALNAVAGHRLQAGDILDVPDGRYAQIEVADSCLLGLEGETRVLLKRVDAGRGGQIQLLLLKGWLRFQPYSSTVNPNVLIETPTVRVTMNGGVALMHAGSDGFELFSEASTPHLAPLDPAGRAGPELEMGREQLGSRLGGEGIKIKPRPDLAFIKSIPPEMRDSLVPLGGKLHGEPPKQPTVPVSYGLIEPWLTSSVPMRRGLAARFQSRVHDGKFRGEIAAHISQLPEWYPILYPPPPPPPVKAP